MGWNFVNASSELVRGLDSEVDITLEYEFSFTNEAQDEVKLLRLRTKKYELVMVPDPKYLLIAVHATSAT